MSETQIVVYPWPEATPPSETALKRQLLAEGFEAFRWSNAPGDIYAAHAHHYDKVLYVLRGSIAFGLPELGQTVRLEAGDRLELPAGVVHNAVVGMDGVICLEAVR